MDYQNVMLSEANANEKSVFYKNTYIHLAIAVLAFILVEIILLRVVPESLIVGMVSTKGLWLFLLGMFWLGSIISNKLVFHPDRNMQYLGLGVYVLLEAIIFMPMIYIASSISEGNNLVLQAGILTLFMFGGLTFIAFTTKRDLSFMRTFLVMGGFISLGLIVAGAIFGFQLGLWFSVGMVVLASGSILYQTQQLKYNFDTNQYVGASLQLFASVMMLFWYILRILLGSRK